jgi:hypothetical protein
MQRPSAVMINKPLKRLLDLKQLPGFPEGVRQMEQHVAVDDLCRTP